MSRTVLAWCAAALILSVYPVLFGYQFIQSSRSPLFSTPCLLLYVLALSLGRVLWLYRRDARTRIAFPASSISQLFVGFSRLGFCAVLASFVGVAVYVLVHWQTR